LGKGVGVGVTWVFGVGFGGSISCTIAKYFQVWIVEAPAGCLDHHLSGRWNFRIQKSLFYAGFNRACHYSVNVKFEEIVEKLGGEEKLVRLELVIPKHRLVAFDAYDYAGFAEIVLVHRLERPELALPGF
jgi:hypothetical protein